MKISTVVVFCIIAGVLEFTPVVHAQAIQGTSGVDYPNYHSIPKTSFSCSEQKYIPGFYADLETNCQAFHFCFKDGQESFLCPTGTIYNQEILACDSWYSSNCSLAPLSYSINAGPVMENAGRNIPMLLKLRDRSQGKSIPTSNPNIFEKLSSLYEESAHLASSEGFETANFSGDSNEMSTSNVSSDLSSEVSEEGNENMENNEQFSDDSSFGVEEDLQGDAGIDDETDEIEYDSMVEEQDGEMDNNIVYDPISDGYYMNYDPYQTEWQQESEPTSDEFRSFYDYEKLGDGYNVMIRDDDGSSEENELVAEPSPEDLDLNSGTDHTDFSRRRLNVEHSPNPYRRRPMYVVLEDDEPENEYPSEDDYLGDEPGLESPSEYANSDVDEYGNGIPVGSALEGDEASDGPEVSEEELERLQFPSRLEYATERPLTSEEFEESSEDALTDFQRDQFVNVDQDPTADDYELGPPTFGADEISTSDQEAYEDSRVDPWYQTVDESGISAGDTDDTFVVLPDESDDSSDSSSDYVNVENAEDSSSEYTYEVDSNEQVDEDNMADAGYAYQDAYEYYKSHREFPDGYEAVESRSFQGPDYGYSSHREVPEGYEAVESDSFQGPDYGYSSHREVPEGYEAVESDSFQGPDYGYSSHQEVPDGYEAVESRSFQGPDYDYSRHYGGQYTQRQVYEDNGEYEDGDYSSYSPEEARLAYPSSFRNSELTDEESYYVRQQYQPMSYMDPAYGAESGYYRDDFSQNPYIEGGENSEYYASDEASEYYTQPETQWVQEDVTQDFEMENQLGVTEVPLPVDENLNNSVESEEREDIESLNDFAPEDESNKQETYYVLDFDEEEKINDDWSEFNVDAEDFESEVNRSPDMGDYSDQLDVKQTFETDSLHKGDGSTSNDSSFYKDGSEMSSESSRAESIGLHSFLSAQNGNANSPDLSSNSGASFNMKPLTDTWSPFVTDSSILDKPVTLSSTLERLAALNAVKPPQASSVGNLDFSSSDSRYVNDMAFPGAMDFGPYGYGASLGQQYGMLDSMQPNKVTEGFSHRTGENDQAKIPKLSSLQERLRSMKQGKFGVFKKYMSSMKNQQP